MSQVMWLLVSAAAPVAIAAAPALGQGSSTCFAETASIRALGLDPGDYFGDPIAVDGDTLVVGAWTDDGAVGDEGAAYVFAFDGSAWVQQAKLVASDAATDDGFGISVAIRGDTVFVGAPYDNGPGTDRGSLYVFTRNGTLWTQVQKIQASDGAAQDFFGYSLAASGDTVLVGASGDDSPLAGAGSVYVVAYDGSAWTEQAKLVASDAEEGAGLGFSAAMSADVAIVGAWQDDQMSGSAYVFEFDGTAWSETAKLKAGETDFLDLFGYSVSIHGSRVAVGAPRAGGPAGLEWGTAYVFVRNGSVWDEEATLVASDAEAHDSFGHAVALREDTIVVGSPDPSGPGIGPGTVYAFERNGADWHQRAALHASGGAPGDGLGYAVAFWNDAVLAGAPLNEALRGCVYQFELEPASGTIYCTCPSGACGNPDPDAGCANSLGQGALLTAFGETLPDEVNLEIRDARPGQPALFLAGMNAVMLPFGDGFRCAGGGVVRLAAPAPIAPDGSAAFGPCYGDATISSTSGVMPGSGVTRRYQCWYRDPGGPCGANFNLSNGYEITW